MKPAAPHKREQSEAEQGFWAPPALPFLEIRTTLNSVSPYAAHFHPAFSLGLILSGQTRFLCGDQEHVAGEGDLVLIEPEMVHSCNPVDGRPRSYHMLYLDRAWCQTQTKLPLTTGRVVFQQRVFKDDELYRRLLNLVEKVQKGFFTEADAFKALIGDLLKDNLDARAFADQGLIDSQKTQSMIAGDLEHRPHIGEIARRLGLRRESFIRKFRRGRGLTPGAFQQCLRLLEGRRLLRQGLSIAEAALAVGYVDQSHFHRMFVKYFSATPRQYRLNRSLFYKK